MNDSGQHQFLVDEELLRTGPRPYGFIVHDQSHPFGACTSARVFMRRYGWRTVFIRASTAPETTTPIRRYSEQPGRASGGYA